MSRSLSLAAYRALARRGPVQKFKAAHNRPKGELVWAHATTSDRIAPLIALGQRLAVLRPSLTILVTLAPELRSPVLRDDPFVLIDTLPADHLESCEQFLDHWAPDVCIWTSGHLRPNIIMSAGKRSIPLFLIDADTAGFDSAQDRWLPELSRQVLSQFNGILACSSQAQRRLLRFGLPSDAITLTGKLTTCGHALPCIDSEVDKFTEHMSGRPCWLAAMVQADEIVAILTAHRNTARLAHRLLLLIAPADATTAEAMPNALANAGLRYCSWHQGELPDESTQVLIVEPEDLGLWYRIAPVCFVASSLTQGHGGRSPFDAAALGSAILYGPNVGHHLEAYSRLAHAGAARIVKDADGLGAAVATLVAPDQAARMAMAGWDVVTEAALVTDQIADLVQDALDIKEQS